MVSPMKCRFRLRISLASSQYASDQCPQLFHGVASLINFSTAEAFHSESVSLEFNSETNSDNVYST